MTGASPASALALPSDRRSLLSGAALASIVAATAAVPALAAEQPSPLEQAYAVWRRAAKAADMAVEATWAAEELYQEPEAPRWSVTSESSHRLQIVDTDALRARTVLDDSDENLANLRAIITTPFEFDATRRVTKESHAGRVERATKTLAAIEAWQAECRSRADACGLTAAREQERPLLEAKRQAREAVLSLTPSSLYEAAIQAAVIDVDWNEDEAAKLLCRLSDLSGIPSYFEEA